MSAAQLDLEPDDEDAATWQWVQDADRADDAMAACVPPALFLSAVHAPPTAAQSYDVPAQSGPAYPDLTNATYSNVRRFAISKLLSPAS